MTAGCGVCKRNVNSESPVKPAGSAILVTPGQRWVQRTLLPSTDSSLLKRLTYLPRRVFSIIHGLLKSGSVRPGTRRALHPLDLSANFRLHVAALFREQPLRVGD